MIRSLQIFCDLVETQSFTETGRRNFLTQSAVSQHLKALEARFGHRLLDRGRRQFALTPAGRMVLESAQDILWRYRRLETALQRPPKEISGTLRIAATLTVGLYELPPYLTAFLRRYPNVDLKLTYLRVLEIYQAVLGNDADVGLVPFPEPHPGLIIQIFKKDRLVVIVPPNHPWATVKRISLKRLAEQPFIAFQAGLSIRQALDRVFAQAHVQLHTAYTFDNVELIKRAVEVGLGVAIVPRKTVASETLTKTLHQLEVQEGPLEHPMGILTRKHAQRPVPAQKLITALMAPATRLADEGRTPAA